MKEKFLIDPNKTLFFWNNRNAKRKQSGSLIFWFKQFLDKVGHDNAQLIMHTNVGDPAGQDLRAIVMHLGIIDGQVQFSESKISPAHMAAMYNIADCTLNIADAEGFGLSSLESLSCGTPVINTMTGGLQEQVTDGENWFGIGLEPTSKSIIGSQQIPWIYEDRLNQETVVNALLEMHNKTPEERKALGRAGREHVLKNYNFEEYKNNWIKLVERVHEEYGSWETRKKYNTWELIEIA